MKPSDVMTQAMRGSGLTGTFGCAELEKAAVCVVQLLSLAGNNWTIPFRMTDARKQYSGTDEGWNLLVSHVHPPDTNPCMLTNWLTAMPMATSSPRGGVKFCVTAEFVSRVTRGADSTAMATPESIAQKVRLPLYMAVARQRPGLRLDDVRVAFISDKYKALIGGVDVFVDAEDLEWCLTELDETLCNHPDSIECRIETPHWKVMLKAEQIRAIDSVQTQAAALAQMLTSEWIAKHGGTKR